MTQSKPQAGLLLARRSFLGAAAGMALHAGVLLADDQQGLKQPIYRVGKRPDTPPAKPSHPLDPALKAARDGLQFSQQNIRDYQCVVVKRERINGKVGNYEYMSAKIRNRKTENGRIVVPFSVYMKFEKPANIKGREVIFVEGRNNGKMMAHEGGAAGKFLPSVWLKPDGPLAMRGQLYPITDLGIENLMVKLLERGKLEKQFPECKVDFYKDYRINKRKCTMIQVSHATKRPQFEFNLAQIFIDDEWHVPIRYAAYDWPKRPGAKPEVLEEYTYMNVKMNVGLTDADFDSKNPAYNF